MVVGEDTIKVACWLLGFLLARLHTNLMAGAAGKQYAREDASAPLRNEKMVKRKIGG
jgi:hypothetical protein